MKKFITAGIGKSIKDNVKRFINFFKQEKKELGLALSGEEYVSTPDVFLERPARIFRSFKAPDSHWFTKTFLRPRRKK